MTDHCESLMHLIFLLSTQATWRTYPVRATKEIITNFNPQIVENRRGEERKWGKISSYPKCLLQPWGRQNNVFADTGSDDVQDGGAFVEKVYSYNYRSTKCLKHRHCIPRFPCGVRHFGA